MKYDDWFPPFKFDLDVEIDGEFKEDVAFPPEMMEIDTNISFVVPEMVEDVELTLHEKLYEISVDSPNTLVLDDIDMLSPLGGSENFLGGSENLG